ncbi:MULTISPECIES: hypothetical protein [Brevundimonas]|nr:MULTISPECIES: hypothetical protein [Brevundimonas]
MSIPTATRLLRLGRARRLTRAGHDGEFFELNSPRKWDMPSE